jgi:hypothetical protein
MPLQKAHGRSKKAVNKAVSANMHELTHHGSRPRSQKQKVAIAISAAKGGKKKK